MAAAMGVVERTYRFCLDVTARDSEVLSRHVGAARWGYNFAHRLMLASHTAYEERTHRAAEAISGLDRGRIIRELPKADRTSLYEEARKRVRAENQEWRGELLLWDEHRRRVVHKGKARLDPGEQPGKHATHLAHNLFARRLKLAAVQAADPAAYAMMKKAELEQVRPVVLKKKRDLAERGAYRLGSYDVEAIWRTVRDLPQEDGGSPWWREVALTAITCGFDRAEAAWRNWLTSATGIRAGGRRVGLPHHKKKGKAHDSFMLPNRARCVIHFDDYRHLRLAGVGRFRLHQSAKRLVRLVGKGLADVTSVTISRSGHRWYASIQTKVQQPVPVKPSRRQAARGLVAVDLGLQPLAWLSDPLNPADPTTKAIHAVRTCKTDQNRLARAQRALSRTQRGSKRRRAAARRVGRIYAQITKRRDSRLHEVSKQLATQAAQIVIENLDLIGMTTSAKGTTDQPGSGVALRSMFSRHLLDAGLGTLRRQLAYKTAWHGSTLIVLDRGEVTATKCSTCGERNSSSQPSAKRFTCPHCGLDIDRRENSVRNILRAASVTPSMSVACGKRDT